jgi:hypothetical protein
MDYLNNSEMNYGTSDKASELLVKKELIRFLMKLL